MKRNTHDDFWARVKKNEFCWVWIGEKRYNYGCFWFKNKKISAHRFSYEIEFGPIPYGLNVLHKCDNPPCVNPDHLFLGTNKKNSEDMKLKDRSAFGIRCARSKLTEADIKLIRLLYKHGKTQMDLSEKFGVKQATISSIILRKTWSRVS